MYLDRDGYCPCCKQTKDIACHSGNSRGWCSDCIQAEEDTQLKDYLDVCDSLTIEQRIRKIELWIYKHEKNPSQSYADILHTKLGG